MNAIEYIRKSKFIRSIFFRVSAVFIVLIIAVSLWVSLSFTAEINKNVISERQKQLEVVESNISKRMEEISSIDYSISTDKSFYLNAVDGEKYSSQAMTSTLSRYLVGNAFIEYLGYYRVSEPDKIYTSCGDLSFHDFWDTYLDFECNSEEEYLKHIKEVKDSRIMSIDRNAQQIQYFTYVTAVPQYSANPLAYVIMLIPISEIEPLLDTQIATYNGEVAVFDNDGKLVYSKSNLSEDIPINADDYDDKDSQISIKGKRYVVNKTISDSNDWKYVSVIRLNDMLSDIFTKQVIFIVFLCLLMTVALIILLTGIIKKYKPINSLAASLIDEESDSSGIIDEKNLLSTTIATLKDDSEQKQKFEMAYKEASEANKAKSVFLSNMSHDIRTPMNAIIGMTDIALDNANDPNHVRECLGKVKIASRYLLDIINNVLDMSRIESGKFTLANEEVRIPEIFEGIIAIVEQSIGDKKLKLVVEADNIVNEAVYGDNVRLTQIFMNIISNSIKFTQENGTVRLRVTQIEDEDSEHGTYEFVFSDTGIGMSEEFVKKVFETFSRASDSGISKIEGTGLGMSIAKNLVELMGGTIKCESEIDKGTRFVVNIRFKLAQDKLVDKLEKDKDDISNIHVLIISNSEDRCQRQKKIFDNIGMKADYATNLTHACEIIKEKASKKYEYQYIIINQSDKDKSGIEASKRLLNCKEKKNTKYVLTANSFTEINQIQAKEVGIDMFIRLPLFTSNIINMINGADMHEKEADAIKKDDVNLEGHRLLLVDDNLLNREIARKIISKTNMEIVEASNGKEAVEIYEGNEPGYFDIVLMDLQMPIMNGIQATEYIRAMKRKDSLTIPIYALTANTFDEDVKMVKEAGMSGHIGKPYVAKELYKILSDVVNNHSVR